MMLCYISIDWLIVHVAYNQSNINQTCHQESLYLNIKTSDRIAYNKEGGLV